MVTFNKKFNSRSEIGKLFGRNIVKGITTAKKLILSFFSLMQMKYTQIIFILKALMNIACILV